MFAQTSKDRSRFLTETDPAPRSRYWDIHLILQEAAYPLESIKFICSTDRISYTMLSNFTSICPPVGGEKNK